MELPGSASAHGCTAPARNWKWRERMQDTRKLALGTSRVGAAVHHPPEKFSGFEPFQGPEGQLRQRPVRFTCELGTGGGDHVCSSFSEATGHTGHVFCYRALPEHPAAGLSTLQILVPLTPQEMGAPSSPPDSCGTQATCPESSGQSTAMLCRDCDQGLGHEQHRQGPPPPRG